MLIGQQLKQEGKNKLNFFKKMRHLYEKELIF